MPRLRNRRARMLAAGGFVTAFVMLLPVGGQAAFAADDFSGETVQHAQESAQAEESTSPEIPSDSDAGSAPPRTAEEPSDSHRGELAAPHAAEMEPHDLTIELSRSKDGTPDWDDLDANASNGIVRTNDTITYTAHVVSTGGHAGATVTLTLPKGVVMQSLPGFCKAGSTLTPTGAQIGGPVLPITSDSWESLPAQIVSCEIGPQGDEDREFDFTAKVRPEVPNGTRLDASARIVCTTDPSIDRTDEISHTAVSTPRYDISKNGYVPLPDDGVTDANNGPLAQWEDLACTFDTSKRCYRMEYPLYVSIPNGGKGASPATKLSFVDDLSPDRFFGPGTTSNPDWKPEYQPRLWVSADPLSGVNSSGANEMINNAVRKSGTPVVTESNGRYTVTISDADLSGYYAPTRDRWGNPLPASAGAGVVSLGVYVEFPREAGFVLGVLSGNRTVLRTYNTYEDLRITDIAGQQNALDADTSRNNTRIHDAVFAQGAGRVGWTKSFIGLPKVTDTGTEIDLSPGGWRRPYVIAPGQVLGSQIRITSNGSFSAPQPQLNTIACDYWDPTQFTITPGYYGPIARPSNGEAVWLTSASTDSTLGRVQYGVHSITPDATLPGGVGAASLVPVGCEDSRIVWYDSLDDVPGGNAAVGAVRAHVTMPRRADWGDSLSVVIALTATHAARPDNTVMPNYASNKIVWSTEAATPSWRELLDGPVWNSQNGEYLPSRYIAENGTGFAGDRVYSGSLYSFIDKRVKNRAGSWVNTVEPYSGGQEIEFQLIPTLFSVAPAAKSDEVFVEDCIPAGFTLLSSSTEYTLQRGADASLACDDGQTYVRWNLGAIEVTRQQNVTPIEYTVLASAFLPGGQYRNTARITAEGDPAADFPSAFPRVTDTQDVLIDVARGVFLEKTPRTPLTSINLPDQTTDERTSWEVRIGNIGQNGPGDMDVIDRLPVDTGTAGNNFHGTMTLVGARITDPGSADPSGSRSMLYYTTAATVDTDPRAAVNRNSDGSITSIWSSTPPANLATVTGVRLVRPGALADGEQLAFEIDMVGVGNAADDRYRNSASSVSHTIGGLLGASADSQVQSSQLGDYVWWDVNRNGRQDVGEPAAENVVVRVAGTDDLGNTVSLETSTGSNGRYAFDLRPSDPHGYVVTFVVPEGASFTERHAQGTTIADDSDADPSTGAAAAVVLGADEVDLNVDAGLFGSGLLQINKVLTGPGAGELSVGDELVFRIVCTVPELDDPVFAEELTLTATAGSTAITSREIGPIPAGADCTVTETSAGSADIAAPQISITIPWDPAMPTGKISSVSMTNRYSAGRLEVTKIVDGDQRAVEAVRDREFTIQLTCQVDEQGNNGATRATVVSEQVTIRGGETERVARNGKPVLIPAGATCFGEEIVTGGATRIVIDHGSFEDGVTVTTNEGDDAQVVSIVARNTFLCTELLCPSPTEGSGKPGLTTTGSPLAAGALMAAIALLTVGGWLLLRRHRSRVEEVTG